MLDIQTKRRIDDARDILVGKVPDPKSQVEQITIALIYKFMDDMDAEAEELGGHRKFFTGDYEKYGWKKLMAPGLGGFEVLTLYSESILQLNVNPNIPQLFRDIFKNAYLPYRDPQTLKSFLKIIDEFDYDHSEKLGDAFEYLLSVLGSQGDAGQFRTPRHIIDFMVYLVDPKKNETILDPACGTAGFLISSYKHIVKSNSSNYRTENRSDFAFGEMDSDKYRGDLLTPDDRKLLAAKLKGYDISPDMVRLSLVNLYLHGFNDPKISEYDTLTSEEKWNEHADVIFANPPFMSPKGGIRPHKRFSVESSRSEVLFLDYIAEHLTPNGRAAIIVPEGIIFQSGTAYKALRKMLVENYLYTVISLPAGVFNPYSGVKTSILLMDKTLAKKTDNILFAKIENDGFDLGAQRRANGKSELPTIASAVKDFANSIIDGTTFDVTSYSNLVIATKERIGENGDWGLSGERYKVSIRISSAYPLVKIEDICTVERGASPRPIDRYISNTEDGINWIKIGDGSANSMYITSTKQKITLEGAKKSKIVRRGDIILSNSMSFGHPYILDIDGCIHDGWLLLHPKGNTVVKEYLYHVLSSKNIFQQFASLATGGVVNNLNSQLVRNVCFPLPPLEVQKEIVAQIESWQKIIDGARQVIENYKPQIEIDPNWEMVELGEVCEINPKKSELLKLSGQTEVSFIPMADVGENVINIIPKEQRTLRHVIKGYTYFAENDVLLAKVTPCFENGKAGIAINLRNGIGFGSTEFFVLRAGANVIPSWIYCNIITNKFRHLGKQYMTGTGGLQRVNKDFISTYKIPLPSIKIQNELIAQVNSEIEIVQKNEEMIKIFETKIKDKIASIWSA